MESAVKIRRLVLRDGHSIRSVSRSTGLSRNTIRKYVNDTSPPSYHRNAPPVLRKLAGFEERLKADNIRLFVMTTPDAEVIGFYALNAHAINYSDLPKKYARRRPAHGNIPAIYISMTGRDEKFKGGGYGADLLVDALTRIAAASKNVGLSVVVLDVLDCGDADRTQRRKTLYESYGFIAMATHPLRMFLPMATVRKMIAEEHHS